LHKNAFGRWAPPGPARGAIVPPDLLAVVRAREGKERVGNKKGEKGKRGKDVKG